MCRLAVCASACSVCGSISVAKSSTFLIFFGTAHQDGLLLVVIVQQIEVERGVGEQQVDVVKRRPTPPVTTARHDLPGIRVEALLVPRPVVSATAQCLRGPGRKTRETS